MAETIGPSGGDEVEYLEVMLSWGIESVTRDQLGAKPARVSQFYQTIGLLLLSSSSNLLLNHGNTGTFGADRWQPTDRGTAIWDSSFDPTTVAAHAFFATTCADLRSKSCDAKGCMDGSGKLVRRDRQGRAKLTCFFDDWRAWYSVSYPPPHKTFLLAPGHLFGCSKLFLDSCCARTLTLILL